MAKLTVEGYGDLTVPDEVKSWPKDKVDALVAEAVAAREAESIDLADVPGEALRNLPKSAGQFASDMVAPIMDPVGTAKGLGNLALGTAQKLIPGEQSSEIYADQVGQFFTDRYGGWENVKRTMAKDPVGFLGDLSTVLGGAGLASRAPGVAGKVGQTARKASQATDPLVMTGRASRATSELLGATTGTSGEAIQAAHRAGRQGGEAAQAFRSTLTDAAPVTDVVDVARQGLRGFRDARRTSYQDAMAKLGRNTEVLDFSKAEQAFTKAIGDFGYKGRFPKQLAPLRQQIEGLLDEWRALDPGEFHTPEGFDQLKKDIWAIQGDYKPGSAQYAFIQGVRKTVEKEIKSQAPEYAKIMGDYRQASEAIDELERSLSLGSKSTTDQALRKLQSIMRNNANTNYGARVKMGKLLEQYGAENLTEMLSGQALSAWAPRGIARGGLGVQGAMAMGVNPATLAALPAQSPRLVGEAAYGVGSAQRMGRSLFDRVNPAPLEFSPRGTALGLFQTGRLAGIEER
jgi:hypothetical protein